MIVAIRQVCLSRGSALIFLRCFATVRLNKRMSELDICSRREADRWIREGRVTVNGQKVVVGEKVDASLSRDEIQIVGAPVNHGEGSNGPSLDDHDGISFTDLTTAVVLNKPAGYVSGQAEHDHQPAIRLLTRERLWNSGNADIILPENSWKGFAPAGRLDLASTGLMVFTHSGVISKKLISHDSTIEKEYVVEVAPAVQETRRELEIDENFRLPKTNTDLLPLTCGGAILLGERRPLKACKAKWLEQDKLLQIVLTEGRKQHIRRACRQLLGYHVVSLERVRIGPINMEDLPQGSWRPLTKEETDAILAS